VELDDTICYCFHVSKRKIINFIRVNRPRVASQVTECGGAGTGCGWCVPFLKRYFEDAKAGSNDSDTLTPVEYSQQRAAYIRSGKGKPPPTGIPLPPE
jgi:NAD(P)H-nitrite reductase large subunit